MFIIFSQTIVIKCLGMVVNEGRLVSFYQPTKIELNIYSFIKANQKRQQKTPVSNKTDLQKLSNLKKKKKTKLNLRSMIFIDYYIQQPQKMHSLTAHMKSRQTTCQFKTIIFKNFKKQKSYRVQFFQHNWK